MIELNELQDAAQKAFPADKLIPNRDESWKLVAEMGWLMLDLPEEQGGLGLGADAFAAIHFEMGRVLSAAPLIPAMLALRAIAASETLADKAGWIERICGGEYVPVNLLPSKVSKDGDALNGVLPGVFDADMARHVLVSTPGFYALVPLDAPGVTVTERTVWDKSRRLFDVTFTGTAIDPALVVAQGDAAAEIATRMGEGALLALSADALGGANATLDLSVEYLKMRKQFDRPLAMFQALKHRCADLKIIIGAAEALMWSRARKADSGVVELGGLKAHATDVYRKVVEEAIQLHGGIGLTQEHQCHLFMKRAMLNLQLGGDADHWTEIVGHAALESLAA